MKILDFRYRYHRLAFFIVLGACAFVFWKTPYVRDSIFLFFLLYMLLLIYHRYFERSTAEKIIVRTKAYNWLVFIIWMILGLTRLTEAYNSRVMVLGDVPMNYYFMTLFFLNAILHLQRNIVFDKQFVHLGDPRNSRIPYSDKFEVKVENGKILIDHPDNRYEYPVYGMNEEQIDDLLRFIQNRRRPDIIDSLVE